MPATFRVTSRRADAQPLRDGFAGVFVDGNADPSLIVEIQRVIIRNPCAWPATTPAVYSVRRITGHSSGTAVSSVKFDTSAATLPAQVTCLAMADTITGVGDTVTTTLDAFPMTAAAGGLGAHLPGRYPGKKRHGPVFHSAQGATSELEGIVLREGEGLSMTMVTAGQSRGMRTSILVRVAATGRCYRFRSGDTCTPEMEGSSVLSLVNGSGSGVVLQVLSFDNTPEGDSGGVQRMRLAYIDGWQVPPGGDNPEILTPVAFDTRNTCPTAVRCLGAGFVSLMAGESIGVPYDWWFNQGSVMSLAAQQRGGRIRGIIYPSKNTGVSPTRGINGITRFKGGALLADLDGTLLYEGNERDEPLVLRPGQGIGVLGGDTGALDNMAQSIYSIIIDFTVRYDAKARKGGVVYVG